MLVLTKKLSSYQFPVTVLEHLTTHMHPFLHTLQALTVQTHLLTEEISELLFPSCSMVQLFQHIVPLNPCQLTYTVANTSIDNWLKSSIFNGTNIDLRQDKQIEHYVLKRILGLENI